MKNILHNLYSGKVIPWERRNPRSEEQLVLVRKIEAEEKYFIGKMSLDDCERFQNLKNLYAELSMSSEVELFAYSFALGILLMTDVYDEAETANLE